MTDESRRRWILERFTPNLAELQENGICVEVKKDGRTIEKRVKPQTHYRKEDETEILVFYNNHFPVLRDAGRANLTKLVECIPPDLSSLKQSLLEKADGTDPEVKITYDPVAVANAAPLLQRAWNSVCGWFGGSQPAPPPQNESAIDDLLKARPELNLKRADELATICASLNLRIQTLGTDITPDSIAVVAVNRDMTFFKFLDTPKERYADVERKLLSITSAGHEQVVILQEISDWLKRHERAVTPSAGNRETVDFCFALNRAHRYVSLQERNYAAVDLATTTAIDKLKRQLDRYLLTFRFCFENNASPILGVRISRCKIIVDTKEETMIYLEANELKEFIQSLKEAMINKASNITRQLEGLTEEDMIKQAQKMEPATLDEWLRQIDARINDLQQKKDSLDQKQTECVSVANVDMRPNGGGLLVEIPDARGGETRFILPVPKTLAIMPPPNVRANDGSDDANDDDALGEEQVEVEATKVLTLIQATGISNTRQTAVKNARNHFIDSQRIAREIEDLKRMRETYREQRAYMIDFINLVKLFTVLRRKKYDTRDDFVGILLTERRINEGNARALQLLLREYKVLELLKEANDGGAAPIDEAPHEEAAASAAAGAPVVDELD